jgi:hypothetical protein
MTQTSTKSKQPSNTYALLADDDTDFNNKSEEEITSDIDIIDKSETPETELNDEIKPEPFNFESIEKGPTNWADDE